MRVDRKSPSTARLAFDTLVLIVGGICLALGIWQGTVEKHYAEATYYLVLFMLLRLGVDP